MVSEAPCKSVEVTCIMPPNCRAPEPVLVLISIVTIALPLFQPLLQLKTWRLPTGSEVRRTVHNPRNLTVDNLLTVHSKSCQVVSVAVPRCGFPCFHVCSFPDGLTLLLMLSCATFAQTTTSCGIPFGPFSVLRHGYVTSTL